MRVGALLRFAWLFVFVLAARCGGVISGGSDGGGGDSSPVPCATSADCPNGLGCFFPVNAGCSAKGQCLAGSLGSCKGGAACTCEGTTDFVVCGPPGYAKVPIQHVGFCDGGIAPPCGSGLACELCDVSGYSPTTMSKPVAMPGACSAQEISDFTTACFDSMATQQTCQAWQTKEADAGACLGCLFTLQSAATWGPIVCTSSECVINSAGCLDLALGQVSQEKTQGGPGSCGDAVNESIGCTNYACATCSTTGSPGQTDFDTCTKSSASYECKSYVDMVNNSTSCAILQGDAAPPKAVSCFPQSTADVPNYLDVFCGTGP